jgi:hypothetical protein
MNNVEPKVEKSESEKTQDFVKEYQALCEKHGYQIVVQPTLIARDDGTWSIKQISSIGKLPKE